MIRHSFTLQNIQETYRVFRGVPKAAEKVVLKTINESLPRGRTVAVDSIVKRLQIGRNTISKDVKIDRARPGHLVGAIHAKGFRLAVGLFSPRLGAKMLTRSKNQWKYRRVRRKPGQMGPFYGGIEFTEIRGRTSILQHAFFAGFSSGHQGVFSRRQKDGSYSKRYPIHEQEGTSVASQLNNPDVRKAVNKATQENALVHWQHWMRTELEAIK
jgi:hypothetical protein